MDVALEVLLILFCLHALVKFAVGFLVPYERQASILVLRERLKGH